MLARNHSPINFNRQPTFVTEMNWCVILFAQDVYLKIPKKVSGKPSLIPKELAPFTVIPLFFIIIKSFFITWWGLCRHPANSPLNSRCRFNFVGLFGDQFYRNSSANIKTTQGSRTISAL